MATIHFTHNTGYPDDSGVAWVQLTVPDAANGRFGAWAEPARSGHDSCTPTSTYQGHSTGFCPLVGTFVADYSNSETAVIFGFRGDPGMPVRIHMWQVS
jgi:hypothetical protein